MVPGVLALGLGTVLVIAGCGSSTPSGSRPAAGGSEAATLPGSATPPNEVPPVCPRTAPAASAGASGAPWWADRVFYEVFVRSFADSDGDGIGDLRGLTDRLDYLNDGDPATTDDLGVTALWLMPVAASPSYHGYDVTDYRKVEADYGTADDFRALMAAAHERGIEIIVDLVINHTSRDHPWFVDARKRGSAHEDWYIFSDESGGFGGPDGRPVWHKDGDRYYFGLFWEGMPDLDLRNADVTRELDGIARFWLEEMGVDGFRLDAARHLIEDGETLENTPETHTWLRGFRERVRAVDPEALLLGEVWDTTSNAARYVADGSLDLAFEFGLASAFLDGVRYGEAATLAAAQAEVIAAYPSGGYATFLTNHDQDRVWDELGEEMAAARLAATLLLTSPGVPFVYYGEELGLSGEKPDERIRTPLPWDGSGPGAGFTTGQPWEALADNAAAANVATQTADPASLLSLYRTLIALRTAHPILRSGTLVPVGSSSEGIYAFLRTDGAETILVIANLADAIAIEPALSLPSGPLCGTPSTEVLLGAAGPGRAAVVAPPVVSASGGFVDWRPAAELSPREAIVVRLGR